MQTGYSNRIFGLDLMRAFAIILVVFSHISWIVPNAQGLIPELMSIAGVIGVEIFFVLSGFLIGKIIYNLYTNNQLKFNVFSYFWVRRWFRTLPNYYLALVINIIIAIYIGQLLPDNLWTYFLFLQNFISEMPLFFQESWSLSIEEFAYIIGPLLLYVVLFMKIKLSNKQWFLFITLVIILISMSFKIIYNSNQINNSIIKWNSSLKAVVVYRLDAIYLGVLFAYISMVKPKWWYRLRYVSIVLGCIIFLGLNTIIPMYRLFIETNPQFWNVWYLPINSLAIGLALPLLSQFKNAPQYILKPITVISLISYSMYLFHYSIVLQLMKYILPSENLAKFDVMVYIMVYISATLLISYIIYTYFEKPITQLRDSKFIKGRFF